jgi:predicted ester cyclase
MSRVPDEKEWPMSNSISLHEFPHLMDDAWNRGDMAAFDSYIDEGVDDAGGESTGLEGVRAILDHIRTAFPDFHYTVDQVIVDGDWLAVRLTATGTQEGEFFGWPATGKRATWKEIRDCRIANDKTVEHHACLDNMGLLAQLGHLTWPQRSNG